MSASFRDSPGMYDLGQQFGNYILIGRLGRGGFADVYLGEHIYLHTQAAVKIVRPQLSSADMRKFFAEARLSAHLRHPHIVRVLEFGQEGPIPFLVMDHAPNGTVRQRYPMGARPAIPVILEYVEQITDALHYIHSQELIHRDIKPENLLLGSNDELLLSDFGIAIAVQKAASGTQTPLGTVAYMAPEQIEGFPCLASDQYALGVVVYEWLCGAKPFQGSMGEIIKQHLSAQPPSLRKRVPNLPSTIEEVVFRALAKDPRDRFKNEQDLATALRDAFEENPLVVRVDDFHPAQQPQIRQSECELDKTGGDEKCKVWKEIAAFYAIDLLFGAALGSILSWLGVAPSLLELLLALCVVLLPLGGALIWKNYPLFFLTCILFVAASLVALLFHALILFIVIYIGLLLLSLLTAFAVSINGAW